MHILPPSEFDLNGHLTFSKKKEKDRYKIVCRKQVIPCKSVDHHALESLNIKAEVLELISNIGWETYFSITCPAYIELVREFYTTFEFKKSTDFTVNTPKVVLFRLKGKEFKLSITEFNVAFRFVTEEFAKFDEYLCYSCDYSPTFGHITLYRTMSTSKLHYNPSNSKDTFLHDPALKYIHRFLAFNFLSKKDSASVLSKAEFYFLWCMKNKIKVNLGYWLVSQFAAVASEKRNLALGSLIIDLAAHEKLINLDDNDLHVACEMQPLSLQCLEKMSLIGMKDGIYHFYPPGPVVIRPKRKLSRHEIEERALESLDEPSTSTTLPERNFDEQFESICQQLTRIEMNQIAFFKRIGFDPPFLPPQ